MHHCDGDPYACESEDCTYPFPELNPFGVVGQARERDLKIVRTCGHCGWKTQPWHVDDGSAECDLHGHVKRAHGGLPTAP